MQGCIYLDWVACAGLSASGLGYVGYLNISAMEKEMYNHKHTKKNNCTTFTMKCCFNYDFDIDVHRLPSCKACCGGTCATWQPSTDSICPISPSTQCKSMGKKNTSW